MTAQASATPAAVRDVIAGWRPPAGRVLAVLPASDLVTAAAEAAGAGEKLTLSVRAAPGRRSRAEVPGAPARGGSREAVAPAPQPQRGLLPAASAAGCGHFRAPAGRAVFCAPGFPLPDAATGSGLSRRGPRGGGEP
jgi:hypothetical protein